MNIGNYTVEELETLCREMGEPKFRAKQIFSWIAKGAESFQDMTNLSKPLREKLAARCGVALPAIEEKLVSRLDGTVKYLYRLEDGEYLETVIMKYKYGYTACVSTQVGCRMGCSFCASTISSLCRNLEAYEIAGQVIRAQKDLGITISHIVFMGMGEPLDNYDAVLRAVHIMNSPDGLGIGIRHFTISTCGLVKNMVKLAEEGLPLTLAVSLHAPNDTVRRSIMPIANAYSMEEVLSACRYYIQKTNRRVTFEYTLIDGVNDSEENAEELADRLHGILCHVNLIPVNRVAERANERSSDRQVQRFLQVLNKRKIEATVRRELGSDINASCGQLRNRHKAQA